MKVVKRYVCEFCGGTYETEEDARKCEAWHTDSTITNMRFAAGHRYPYEIDIRFGSGAVVTYFCEGV